jgi:hypothetical protein
MAEITLIQGTRRIDLPNAFDPASPGHVLKFDRAVDHLNAITEETGALIEHGFEAPSGKKIEELEDGWVVIRWGDIPPLSPRFALYLGDYLHNVRASLDYLVYELVIANGQDPGSHSQFPIYDSLTKWTQDIEERDPTLKPSPVEGVSNAAFEAIKAMQPFRKKSRSARQNHALMHLLRLSNADKHRSLHVGAIHTGKLAHLRIEPRGYGRILKKRVAPAGRPVKSGEEIARLQVEWLREPDAEAGFAFGFPVQIAFGEEGKPASITFATLFNILNRVVEVRADLEPYL